MSWRVVVVSTRSKLEFRTNYLVIRNEKVTRVHLSEISVLIIENTGISLTASLLSELTKAKVKVIFCDEKRNPSSELVSYYGSHDTSLKVRNQISWKKETKEEVWTEIVTDKIRKQCELLKGHQKEEWKLLEQYISEVQMYDETNREGHAAKVYFNSLFGKDFSRTKEDIRNFALNYGYGILLAAFNREITANGYITQLGLFHDNMFNNFNLGSDLMEPFRPLVDKLVYNTEYEKFETEEKLKLVNIMNQQVIIDGKKQTVNNAIKIYTKSIFNALDEKDISVIRLYKNEL